MFNSSNIKPNQFEVYNVVQTNFINIKNLNCFNVFTIIPPSELLNISNVTLDSVDKLSDISAILVKKINDSSLSVVTNEILTKMQIVHNELLDRLAKFNLISLDISDNYKIICQTNLNQEAINYMYYDIINRYKLIIIQILDCIKRLNVYVSLIKDKIN